MSLPSSRELDFDAEMKVIEEWLAQEELQIKRIKTQTRVATVIVSAGAILTLLFPIRLWVIVFVIGLIGVLATLVECVFGLINSKRILRDLRAIREKYNLD